MTANNPPPLCRGSSQGETLIGISFQHDLARRGARGG